MKKLILFVLLLLCSSITAAQTLPVKNADPTSKSISKQEVYWIYTMRTRFWSDGGKIVVYYQDFDSPVHRMFCREVLQVNPITFQNSVDTYVNVGNASYFRKVSGDQEMYRMVARTPGAVGYLSEKSILVNNGGRSVVEISIVD